MIAPSDSLSARTLAVVCASDNAYSDSGLMQSAIRKLTTSLGWGDSSAFSRVVPHGARVMVKPNLVLHRNMGPSPYDSVITHPALIQQVVSELLLTTAAKIRLGDAPIQSCDFEALLKRTGLGQWSNTVAAADQRFSGIQDFRRTTSFEHRGVRVATENKIDRSRYILFDLGSDSLLEPVTSYDTKFRITSYPPKFLSETHCPGRHQYLITRDVLDADVIVNLPKLKMHKKAGVTNALKNLVGINGNKEYLPHHRLGGSDEGGDCYPGRSRVKRGIEHLYDIKNSTKSTSGARLAGHAIETLSTVLRLAGDQGGIEGSWSGNDTVWRMSLDLNRILMYGRSDGTMADTPQRIVLHICDAIIAGQGSGPLSPEPFHLNLVFGGMNAAATDYAGAVFLGFDPDRIPIVARAFENFRWPLVSYKPADVNILSGNDSCHVAETVEQLRLPAPTSIPFGWRNAATRLKH